MEELKTAVIAIVGRPNVGKSTLFNRLINKRLAITSEIAGTTRDRIYYHTEFNKLPAILVDTGGLEYGKKENIEADVQTQVQLAIKDADLIIFLFDVKEGLTIEDFEAASALRKSKKKIILVANKSDSHNVDHNLAEAYKLGFGEAIQISAYHNQNIDGLIDEVEAYFKKQTGFRMREAKEELHKIINISFIGKPNVGKSSMVNALLGENKVIVSEIPGTTRDAIDTEITYEGQKFNLIDTAGLRRRGKIEKGLEKISSFRTLDAVERSDIVCLMLDYQEGIKKQDQHISSYITEAGKGLILIVNKTDLMDDRLKEENRLIRILKSKFDFLPWAPVIFVSALRHTNVEKIFELARNIYEERFKTIPKEELMDFMKETVHKHLPPSHGHIHPRFFSLEQVDTNPPKFVYYVSSPQALHFSYRRYLENELREKYHFTGTAIKVVFKPKFGKIISSNRPQRPGTSA